MNYALNSDIKQLKALSSGFQFLEYLSFEFEYFANLLQISNKII